MDLNSKLTGPSLGHPCGTLNQTGDSHGFIAVYYIINMSLVSTPSAELAEYMLK